MRWLGALALALAFLAPGQTTGPIAGQPIIFEAEHDGVNTVAYAMEINGVRTGAEVPVAALTAGLVQITLTGGLASGSYTAQMVAINRGTNAEGLPFTTVAKSNVVTLAVSPSGGEPTPVTAPAPPTNVRLEWLTDPEPPPANGGVSTYLTRVTAWQDNLSDTRTATVHAGEVQQGERVLTVVMQTGSGARTFTVQDQQAAHTQLGMALIGPVPSSRGAHLWLGPVQAITEPVSVTATINATGVGFGLTALVLRAPQVGPAQIQVETVDVREHRCGPTSWTAPRSGLVVCAVFLSGTAVVTPVTPGALLLPGGDGRRALLGRVVEAGPVDLRFTTSVVRRAATAAVLVTQ